MTTYSNDGTKIWTGSAWEVNPNRISWTDAFFFTCNHFIGDVPAKAVYVTGNDDQPWFINWPGVGYSPVEYSMKAVRTVDGRIFRPSADRTGYAVEIPVAIPARNVKCAIAAHKAWKEKTDKLFGR